MCAETVESGKYGSTVHAAPIQMKSEVGEAIGWDLNFRKFALKFSRFFEWLKGRMLCIALWTVNHATCAVILSVICWGANTK